MFHFFTISLPLWARNNYLLKADCKLPFTLSVSQKNINIMLAFTVGTLLLVFVRTPLVYGASADHAVGTTSVKNNVPYQTRLSEDTFEWLKTVTLVTHSHWSDSDRTELHFRLMNTDPGTPDDNLVQKALGAWAKAIKSPIIEWSQNDPFKWRREEAAYLPQKGIVHSRQEIERLLGPVIVWKRTLFPPLIHHLIIRQVGSDTYEWMEVSQPNPDKMLDQARPVVMELRPVGFDMVQFLDRWRFGSDERDGKRLTEICSTFAEQQIKEWQNSLDDIIRQMQEYPITRQTQEEPPTRKLKFLNFGNKRLYSLFEDLQGIRRRKRERQVRDGVERELQWKQRESQMTARLEASRIREENLESQRAATQKLLDETREKHNRDLAVAESQIAGIKKQMEDQIQKTETERSAMIAQLEAYRIREENQESRRAEAQHQLEECQKAAADSEQEFHRKEKENSHWIMMAVLIGGAVMLLMIGIFIFVLCRRAGRGIIETSEEMKRELGAQGHMRDLRPSGPPGSVAVDVAEMDPRFRCSRDPQVAALRHSILADENGQFGVNQIEKVTEQEGIDISVVTRQSTIDDAEEGELMIQAIKEGVKGAVERKHSEPKT